MIHFWTMRVSRLELTDFRNYRTLKFSPAPGLNLVIGPNAQGKTNILESLYALATTRSHRARRDTDMVRFGADAARIVAEVTRENAGDALLEMAIAAPNGVGGEKKLVKINHGKQARVTDLIGNFNAVLFSSTDIDIIRGEPEERRRFLNYEIAQVSPRYILALGAYKRALEQRNRLLKDVKYGATGIESLDVWTTQIIEHGSKIIERRRAYLDKLSVHAAEVHRDLTNRTETLTLSYAPSFPLSPDTITAEEAAITFKNALALVRRDELSRGSTLLGPQRDDLLFYVGTSPENATDVKIYGSQGQQRTAALSLRLAERRLIKEMVGEEPVVLLDDVLSDLDETRRGQIFALALSGGQTFLTATDVQSLPAATVAEARIWHVNAGIVSDSEG